MHCQKKKKLYIEEIREFFLPSFHLFNQTDTKISDISLVNI